MSRDKREKKTSDRRGSDKKFGGRPVRKPYKSRSKTNKPYKKEATLFSEDYGELRLSRFMSLAGVASRRQCDEIIAGGEVTVNGNVIIAPGTKVTTDDTIMLNGQQLSIEKKV